jgi:enoyl-[acyl-carrier protein] reductase II
VVAVRAIKNKGMDTFGRLQLDLIQRLDRGEINHEQAQFEVENYWVGTLRKAVQDGDVDNGSLMAGQSVGLVDEIKPMKAIIGGLVRDCEEEIKRVHQIIHAFDKPAVH